MSVLWSELQLLHTALTPRNNPIVYERTLVRITTITHCIYRTTIDVLVRTMYMIHILTPFFLYHSMYA